MTSRLSPGSSGFLCCHDNYCDAGGHHHASLSIAAYGFLMAQRLKANGSDATGKKTSSNAKCLPFPKITSLGEVQRA